MTVFRTYFKILKAFLVSMSVYIVITIVISSLAGSNNQESVFSASKPNVVVVDEDNSTLSKAFIEYVKSNSEMKEIGDTEEEISDALFFREVDAAIRIPANFKKEFMQGNPPKIETRAVPDSYSAKITQMLYNRFWSIASVYAQSRNECRKNIQSNSEGYGKRSKCSNANFKQRGIRICRLLL